MDFQVRMEILSFRPTLPDPASERRQFLQFSKKVPVSKPKQRVENVPQGLGGAAPCRRIKDYYELW